MNKISSSKRALSVYSNLSYRIKQQKDARARIKAERLAALPKEPLRRLVYRLNPKRQYRYWSSREGGLMMLKIAGVGILGVAIVIGGLFAYYRQELQAIRPEALANSVQTTVTTYLDRNGKVIWKDRGTDDYKIVVDFEDINNNIKEATLALEDREFYEHRGVSISAITRAAWHNFTSESTQGGSTLTQQLVKKIFFTAEEQNQRSGLDGLSRKAKEAILAVEVERMYTKDQILGLYLNTVPYGGRHNGVESAARTYFDTSADKLNVAQSALLASIPQNPSYYNPYYQPGNEALLNRQQYTIDQMVSEGYISEEKGEQAKQVFPDSATLQSKLKPLSSRYDDAEAPHFLLEVRERLVQEFGHAVIGKGGLTVKTTLDLEAQNIAEKAVAEGMKLAPTTSTADNMGLVSQDVKTGQIIAMVGSADFYNESINGSVNTTTSQLEPGSSVKPYDYATLMKNRPSNDFGAGSTLTDENINDVYCAGNVNECSLGNYTGRYYGEVTIRQALGSSLNIPAVKAMSITGVDAVVNTARDMGAKSFCSQNENPSLSASIGGGCSVTPVDHTAGYATLARGGVYKEPSYILEVTNGKGNTLKKWKNKEGKRAIHQQIAYMLSDILTDPSARSLVFANPYATGFEIPDVMTAVKTGTTDNGNGQAKDGWTMSYSPVVATGIWSGNHNGTPINSDHAPENQATHIFMEEVHKNIYQPAGKWNPDDWFEEPQGIQTISVNGKRDIFPSWFNKNEELNYIEKTFDKVSKKLATNCTPERAKETLPVQIAEDVFRDQQRLVAPDGYSVNEKDDIHKCGDRSPAVYNISINETGNGEYLIEANVRRGTHPLDRVTFAINGNVVQRVGGGGNTYAIKYEPDSRASFQVTVTAIDQALYSDNASASETPRAGNRGDGGRGRDDD